MSISKQEFTDAGRSMLGRAQNSEILTITQIVVGDGAAAQPSDLWPLTALISSKLNVTISAKLDYGDGKMLVEGSFTSDAASAAFYLREVGVMAHIASEADRLYSVANVFADPPDYVDPAAPTIQAFKIKLVIDRIPTASLVVQIGASENVLGENVGLATVGPGVYKEAVGNVLRFKRLEAGVGITVIEDAGANKITVAAKQLMQNVDLYVPATYVNPPPGTLPEQFFATIQAAHDYLLGFHIPSDKIATIHVDGGHYTQTVPINFTHPDAYQIAVVGLAVVPKTVSGTITRAGTLPNLDITIPIPSGTTGMAVNDVVYLYDAPQAQLESCGYVTQVLGTSVIVRMRIQNILPPSSIAALASTKLLFLPTQFSTNVSTSVFNCPNGIKAIKNIGLRASTGAQLGTAVSIVGQGGTLEHVFTVNYGFGFSIAGDAVYLTPIVSANACNVGMEVGPSGTIFLNGPNPVGGYDRLTWSGNVVYGLWVSGGSYVSGVGGSATWACSNATGVRSDTRGWCGVSNTGSPAGGWVLGYNNVGAAAVLLGIFQSAIDVTSGVALNVTWDLRADNGGQVLLVYNSTMSGLYSPALGVLGPSGGYVAIGALNP
jgi:hypothetical protein